MKTSKSPEQTETTPSKKKLTQARLPFKLISDVSPKPVTPQTRKRKLSTPEVEPVPKVGKISKENDLIEEPVIISDDDSKGCENPPKVDKTMNPFVKLVDTAWKKKLQKSKKRKTNKKKSSKSVSNESIELESGPDSADNKEPENELMDVEEVPNTHTELNGATSDPEISDSKQEKDSTELSPCKVNCEPEQSNFDKVNEVVILEDSNNPDDKHVHNVKNVETINSDDDEDTKVSEDHEISDSESSKDAQKSIKSPSKTPAKENQITPKRSMRNKEKAEQMNNSKGSPISKLNDSMCSTPTMLKTSRSSSVTNSQGDVSVNESTPTVNLTPKQAQKKMESAKKREEREKEKQERDKKKQQEKEERAKVRQEKEEQRKREKEEKEEAKRKEREEKDEQKRKEKEERDRQKELEKKQREEKEEQKRKEKEEKEEQKRKEKEAREEEKRKKQEALELEKQEQELKKKKAAEAFVNFFVPKQKSEKDQATVACVSKTNMLSNFMIKNDMRLAPLVRVDLSTDKKENLVKLIEKQTVSKNGLYLKNLKNGTSKPLTSGKTWPMSDKDDDDDEVMIVEDELPSIDGAGEILTCEPAQREKLRPKLLSFHENRRPPYWGTWRKKSTCVKPRRPFGQDEKQLDYEVDSDEEWEEEQEGESIDGSAAGSDDEQDPDEYEVDNVVFVPHGYLSDEEATMDEDDVLSLSPETQKQRLKHLEDEFESEMKKPTEKLKPRMYGLLWETADGGKPENCVDALWNYFGKLSMIMNDPTPLLQPASEPEETEKKKVKKKKPQKETADNEQKQKSPKNEKKKKTKNEDKESKTPKSETKKNVPEVKKNQPGINMFLTKLKSS